MNTDRCGGGARGFSLIELMVAMLLGLVVVGGVISVFLSNQRVYRTSAALSDVQNGTRYGFEMMSREIRSAGLTGCNNDGRIANVLKNGPNGTGADWWADTDNAVHGYDSTENDPVLTIGTAETNRVAGTDSLQLVEANYTGLSVDTDDQGSAKLTLNETSDSLKAGDVMVVCDPDHAAIFQSTGYSSTAKTIDYAANSGTPGNCSSGIGYPTSCAGSGETYTYGQNAQVSELTASDWYIGYNPDHGKSLYRVALVNVGGAAKTEKQEMVRGVTGMQITYHVSGGATYEDATAVANWGAVDAIRVELTAESTDTRAGSNSKAIKRTVTATTTIRNRVL